MASGLAQILDQGRPSRCRARWEPFGRVSAGKGYTELYNLLPSLEIGVARLARHSSITGEGVGSSFETESRYVNAHALPSLHCCSPLSGRCHRTRS